MKNAVTRACAWVSFVLLTCAPLASAQNLEIFAGGARFVDVPGNQVPLQPQAIAVAPNGALYVSDINGLLIRVNVAQGTATALPATSGGLNFNLGSPNAIAFDSSGTLYASSLGGLYKINGDGTSTSMGPMPSATQMMFGPGGALYFLEAYESRLWAHLPNGSNIVIAGSTGSGFAGDGGPAVNAYLNNPKGFKIAANGDIYIADTNNHRIRKVSAQTGIISTVAGTGTYGFNGDGLLALGTNVSQPYSVTFDATGSLIFAGSDYRIRRLDATSGRVSTIAGTASVATREMAVPPPMRSSVGCVT
jgi:sugar lactone lactonase YvrE